MKSILLITPKYAHNVGGAVRALSCFGGGEVFYTGDRFDMGTRLPREERTKAYTDTPWKQIAGVPAEHRPVDSVGATLSYDNDGVSVIPVAVELLPSSEPLHTFEHPEHALYVFGPEDGSLPDGIRRACHRFVTIPSLHCLNLASAVAITLYDRHVKRVAAGLEQPHSVEGEARGWWYSPDEEYV